MPSRTYTGVDVLNYILDDSLTTHSSANGSSSASITPVSQFVLSGVGAATDSNTPAAESFHTTLQAIASGDLPYTDPLIGIPDGATIQKITINVSGSGNGNASASSGITVSASATAFLTVEFPSGVILPPDQGYNDGEVLFNEPLSAVVSASGSSPGSFEINLPNITKAQLITDYGSIIVNIASAGSGGSDGVAGTGGAGSAAAALSLNNFTLIVDYTDPAIDITLVPSSGNVEPGQSITITGPGVENFTYAALQDDKVIPITPKVIGPDEIVIPVPVPPKEDCEAALADCPECEECFDACQEDLNSEACQKCLENCFDCLEEVMEDYENAEECQESQQDDPPVNIVIICGDPTGTQFTGSVPLGNFTIIVANASGIYRLVDGKTNDTLYATARDGSTYDVKIPNPLGKTGFFRE